VQTVDLEWPTEFLYYIQQNKVLTLKAPP